jgi:23S rRNA pseudouridine1911/1915/1917 synthase
MGSPILGDLKYGAGNPLPDRSIALHSRQLITPHPVKTNPSVSISAPYPKKQWWDLFKEESKAPKKRR